MKQINEADLDSFEVTPMALGNFEQFFISIYLKSYY